jgi:hypothetical protein
VIRSARGTGKMYFRVYTSGHAGSGPATLSLRIVFVWADDSICWIGRERLACQLGTHPSRGVVSPNLHQRSCVCRADRRQRVRLSRSEACCQSWTTKQDHHVAIPRVQDSSRVAQQACLTIVANLGRVACEFE